MPGVEPLPQTSLPVEASQLLALVEQGMGFVPNSILTMARVPGLFEGVAAISRAVVLGGLVRPELAQMVAHVASTAASLTMQSALRFASHFMPGGPLTPSATKTLSPFGGISTMIRSPRSSG